MPPRSLITPPTSIGDALSPLISLSEQEFTDLLQAVSGPRSFSLSKDEVERLQRQLGFAGSTLSYLLAVLSFIYNQVDSVVEDGKPYDEAIEALIQEISGKQPWAGAGPAAAERLKLMLRSSDARRRLRKTQRLRSGFLPNAVGFSSFVDLRPDFGGDGDALSLNGAVEIIQFRVTTDAEGPPFDRMVFQLTEETLRELKKAVDRANDKLALLKANPVFPSSTTEKT